MDKIRTTVTIRADLLQFAKFADINLSKTLEGALSALQVEEAKRLWLAENTVRTGFVEGAPKDF